MILASIGEYLQQSCFELMIWLCLGTWAVRRLFNQFDSGGEIKNAARGGIINMLGRWLK